MKLKFLVKLIEKIFGIAIGDDQPRADMFLPDRLLAISLVLLAGGGACVIITILNFAIWVLACAVFGIVFGIFAFLCWRNQSIHVISDEQFTYTTMFGNTRTYSFSDIQGIRQNNDSLTLFVDNQKIHIESMAIISERLVILINNVLKQAK